ncbi:DISARM system SNF2-like helicase DrmD [Leptolyngbya sp. AN03gr2]|uniref:DISARM system SNF2-like helicase DrmD n=1 Tax=unclassified Leptolyngbya TaxID=2650499 RepID=UPI003D314391
MHSDLVAQSPASIKPRIGMLATVRNRRALISSVEAFDAGVDGQLHLVTLEYTDADGVPEDTLIWERELNASVLEPTALPQIEAESPMLAAEFEALVRATRWTALSPFLPLDRSKSGMKAPVASPFFGAVQVEDFQLVPLLKALQMPRISLLLADDVGLGKTVEAGLILTELLLRRRIRRVLILCPAALRKQWQQEMRSKFSLNFDVVDRHETHSLQKRLGLDANPWRTYPRIITSYHYLKQADVLEQFRAACVQPEGSAQLPWDLLIVDEAHNLMPSNFGEDSDLAAMLRSISPWFEHKLFLTATPHNGHTRCFSGLLEQLDPVRFTQTSEFSTAMKDRIAQVVIRRLKREINELDQKSGKIPRFCDRYPQPIPLYFRRTEKDLSQAFQVFRAKVKQLVAAEKKTFQLAGSFAVEVLNKRLLSCPYTFAQSWYRFKEGIAQSDTADVSEVNAAKRAIAADLDDDQEVEGRLQHAARTVGAWLKQLAPHLTEEVAAIDQALSQLGLLTDGAGLEFPAQDERWERLVNTIKQNLRNGTEWRLDERLVIFTEYKTTLDYLHQRLYELYPESGVIRVLFGGMTDPEREEIKQAFNDPDSGLRILIATDAASEGLNLQETCHLILHFDIPWNPARLDQRNGRLDRHGQARDVIVFHFTSEDDADLKFLAHVVQKVNTIREELGSMGEVFDAAFQRRFVDFEESDRVIDGLDLAVEKHRGRAAIPTEEGDAGKVEAEALQTLADEVDLSPETLRDTLEIALSIGGLGLPRFEAIDSDGRVRLKAPIPPKWEALVDDYLRLETPDGTRGALPAIVFDPQHFIQYRNHRPVFRAAKDTTLVHLGHPLYHQALSLFARARFPGGLENPPSRWIVRYGEVPKGWDGILLLTVEEMAVNELRESFHHWVRTVRYAIVNGELGEMLPHVPAKQNPANSALVATETVERAKTLWENLELDVREQLKTLTKDLTAELKAQLKKAGQVAQRDEQERFRTRLLEVDRAMKETTLQKLEKERDTLLSEMQQGALFPEYVRQQEEKLRDLEDELRRRRNHYQGLFDQLRQEQSRVLERILPQRYQLRGIAQVFPVTIEFRLPKA